MKNSQIKSVLNIALERLQINNYQNEEDKYIAMIKKAIKDINVIKKDRKIIFRSPSYAP
jgi:hypothetical protein